ncbi:hypothetical protein HHK36_001973 [Tetracentron sinense]|uniref:Uncharacterized protein n=1 Tax=Tetracentron sinense TaxID=13715 RepID=A0A834ZUB2_TETSI|nr:hypothetical protein HHK36_001973 [Tetracentron sinense]
MRSPKYPLPSAKEKAPSSKRNCFITAVNGGSLVLPTARKEKTESNLMEAVNRGLRKMLINPNVKDPLVLGVRVWPQAISQFLVGHLDLLEATKIALGDGRFQRLFLGANYVPGMCSHRSRCSPPILLLLFLSLHRRLLCSHPFLLLLLLPVHGVESYGGPLLGTWKAFVSDGPVDAVSYVVSQLMKLLELHRWNLCSCSLKIQFGISILSCLVTNEVGSANEYWVCRVAAIPKAEGGTSTLPNWDFNMQTVNLRRAAGVPRAKGGAYVYSQDI